MKTNSSALVVPPAAPAEVGGSDIRPLRGPVEIPTGWAWIGWLLLAAALAALAIYFWRRGRQQSALLPAALLIPPHVRAKQRLAEALRHIGNPKPFCIAVSDALRVYLEERFSFRAPDRTTEEFMIELQSSPHLTLDQRSSLAEFLQACDMVKFAQFEPTEESLRALHESALRLIDETQFEPISELSSREPAASSMAGPEKPREEAPK